MASASAHKGVVAFRKILATPPKRLEQPAARFCWQYPPPSIFRFWQTPTSGICELIFAYRRSRTPKFFKAPPNKLKNLVMRNQFTTTPGQIGRQTSKMAPQTHLSRLHGVTTQQTPGMRLMACFRHSCQLPVMSCWSCPAGVR